MRLKFTKMHGLGNDFVVIDAISQRVLLDEKRVRAIADRRFGVGCDQILLVEIPSSPDVDFRYRIFNADGSEVENCGNGARCFAKFVTDRKLTGRSSIRVETANGKMTLHLQNNGEVTVDMGIPVLNPEHIPFTAAEQATHYPLEHNGIQYTIGAVSMGNPHAVLTVGSTETAEVETIGAAIETHPRFPKRVNVGFMEVIHRGEINLRVFERGAGETLACGTGACAAVVAGCLQNLLDSNVKVNLPGGSLTIQWQGPDTPVLMTGPATTVYHGQIRL
ncbi:diaminopimelate epimerase [Marinibactrum halimedae]|uniref:Diaminopimelate epimerase n=1 Tax=Marinibactrum halimedae TaxID=1444977 RepID=A0AA37WPC4_9GAMM|nr:diaminopimelate epimerase [Marinibactrum halimedae]MCD9458292.1 diaminopimelate epimerase [Marinibactrum halimedae]GLS27081.1 diaminopimelate epimerase [Marinibactrum halimedae]